MTLPLQCRDLELRSPDRSWAGPIPRVAWRIPRVAWPYLRRIESNNWDLTQFRNRELLSQCAKYGIVLDMGPYVGIDNTLSADVPVLPANSWIWRAKESTYLDYLLSRHDVRGISTNLLPDLRQPGWRHLTRVQLSHRISLDDALRLRDVPLDELSLTNVQIDTADGFHAFCQSWPTLNTLRIEELDLDAIWDELESDPRPFYASQLQLWCRPQWEHLGIVIVSVRLDDPREEDDAFLRQLFMGLGAAPLKSLYLHWKFASVYDANFTLPPEFRTSLDKWPLQWLNVTNTVSGPDSLALLEHIMQKPTLRFLAAEVLDVHVPYTPKPHAPTWKDLLRAMKHSVTVNTWGGMFGGKKEDDCCDF